MDNKYNLAKEILTKYHQEHLLMFYDDLDDNKKELLLNQILSIDFSEILTLYKNSYVKDDLSNIKISPIQYTVKENLDKMHQVYYVSIGEKILKTNSYAVITVAGGQGTRLGYKGPKGTYELDLTPKKSLFEIQCENLKLAKEQYNVTIPWYIMTSIENNKATINYFKQHDFFGYPKEYITFFIQDKLPIIDTDGKLILTETYLIKEASNGNGNIFASMKKNNIIADLISKNIKWIFIGGIDNVLLETVDPLFIGLTISKNLKVASKSIFKDNALDKDWVFCKVNNKPCIFDCDSIDKNYAYKKDTNNYFLYRDINILSHLFNIDAIQKLADVSLPYHRAYKKNNFINEEGMKQVPDKPNTFKFENFIFDSFKYFDDMHVLRVKKEDEFSPIKDFTSVYNPDNAKDMYIEKLNRRNSH